MRIVKDSFYSGLLYTFQRGIDKRMWEPTCHEYVTCELIITVEIFKNSKYKVQQKVHSKRKNECVSHTKIFHTPTSSHICTVTYTHLNIYFLCGLMIR